MNDFVHLYLKRNRGWPTPKDSWGLTPMFGEDGWCHACGTPLREQCGPLTLKPGGMSPLRGAFVPNWRFDVVCLEDSLASAATDRFNLNVLEVAWQGPQPGTAKQIVIPSVGDSWYDQEALVAATIETHGSTGNACPSCGTWRWLPLGYDALPQLVPSAPLEGFDVCASPEWFGDGYKSFRQILIRRELAQLIVEASPQDFRVQEAR
jgi:hypothetical protein